jgi:hypothetical protein
MAFDECTRILVITVTLKNHENDAHRWLNRFTNHLENYHLNMATNKHFFLLFKVVPIKI